MTTLVDAPARVDGVQLIGEMVGSGYRTPPALVRRGDGQTLQLTPLLYAVLDAADGRRTCAEIADVVGRGLGRSVTEDDVRDAGRQHLRPLGLLKLADGSEPALKRSNPLLGLKLQFAVTNPRTTRRLTDPFRFLFRPVLAAAVVVGFLAVMAGSSSTRPRRLGVRRLPAAAPAAARLRGDRALRRLPRVRARCGREVTAVPSPA